MCPPADAKGQLEHPATSIARAAKNAPRFIPITFVGACPVMLYLVNCRAAVTEYLSIRDASGGRLWANLSP